MQKYIDLLMGLVSGLVLILLNNNIVHTSINRVLTLFDPTNLNSFNLFLMGKIGQLIILLSFIGIFITITYTILILRRVVLKK